MNHAFLPRGLARRALRFISPDRPRAVRTESDPETERARPAYEGARTYAFLTGCSRSGTTALTQLVNRHPDVAIGYERYRLLAQAGGLRPELFEPDRFRDFREGDGSWKSYAGMEKRAHVLNKAHAARVVGDKIPHLVDALDQLDVFPDARVIFIVREPFGVAKSFDARARSQQGGWPADRDFQAAVQDFNRAMANILAYARRGKPYLLLEYDGLFLRREGLREIWEFLGVDPAALPDLEDIFGRASGMAEANRSASIAREVSLNVDFGAWRQVLSLDRMPNRGEIMEETAS
ncbi:sulfotransferase family protein [Amaricoccus solimangrovi]|uniref:Sulfotransferase n=1 Tax=Amaricoccus solimangrovi TaxID=2589815 RepID=A0A501WNC8_9RHOB|nr:sulfotransferase [Amaricoccus solimangrovi]TPE48797.1 sulfotransferase [Amaricoccus solimangrovi]